MRVGASDQQRAARRQGECVGVPTDTADESQSNGPVETPSLELTTDVRIEVTVDDCVRPPGSGLFQQYPEPGRGGAASQGFLAGA